MVIIKRRSTIVNIQNALTNGLNAPATFKSALNQSPTEVKSLKINELFRFLEKDKTDIWTWKIIKRHNSGVLEVIETIVYAIDLMVLKDGTGCAESGYECWIRGSL